MEEKPFYVVFKFSVQKPEAEFLVIPVQYLNHVSHGQNSTLTSGEPESYASWNLNQGLCKNAQLQAAVNCSCLCSLHFVRLITNAKPCPNSV
jgi:hypothetical protein